MNGWGTNLALGKHGLDVRPRRALSSITEQVHDDGALVDRLVHLEQVLAWHPSVLLRLFPALAILPHANDHVETIVAQVEPLAVTLRAVADQSQGVVLEVVQELVAWPVITLWSRSAGERSTLAEPDCSQLLV